MPTHESTAIGVKEKIDLRRLRQALGLPQYVSKKRKCLKCDKDFMSHGFDHRLCANCAQTNENARWIL